MGDLAVGLLMGVVMGMVMVIGIAIGQRKQRVLTEKEKKFRKGATALGVLVFLLGIVAFFVLDSQF